MKVGCTENVTASRHNMVNYITLRSSTNKLNPNKNHPTTSESNNDYLNSRIIFPCSYCNPRERTLVEQSPLTTSPSKACQKTARNKHWHCLRLRERDKMPRSTKLKTTITKNSQDSQESNRQIARTYMLSNRNHVRSMKERTAI